MVHPNLAELYRRRVMDLEKLLADPELGSEAMELIRSMITEIKVAPRKGAEGVDLELAGDLAHILHLCSTSSMQNAQTVTVPTVQLRSPTGSRTMGLPIGWPMLLQLQSQNVRA
jgi:hypothetical protein